MHDLANLMSHLKLTQEECLQLKISRNNVLPDDVEELLYSDSFRESFLKLVDNSARIKSVLAQKPIRKFIEQLSALQRKWSENCKTNCCSGTRTYLEAVEHRNKGNLAFGEKQMIKAAVLYSEAIRAAPASSDDEDQLKELPFAYGNRAAVFNHLGQYEDAIKDVDAALFHGYARYKHPLKLLIRKAECLNQLKRFADAKEVLEKAKPVESKKGELFTEWNEAYQNVCKNLKTFRSKKSAKKFSISGSELSLKDIPSVVKHLSQKSRYEAQPKLSSLSTKVAIRYDSVNGYHLVAAKKIRMGEVLGVATPYVAILDRNQIQDQRYCNHCLDRLTDKQVEKDTMPSKWIRSVPCLQCPRVMYCSEACRTEAWESYHRFECYILPTLSNFTGPHLALRTLFTAGGLDAIRKVAKKFNDETLVEFSDPINYEDVYSMKSTSPHLDAKELIALSITACFTVELAKIGGEFLKGSKKEDDLFAAEIVLRHLIQFRVKETTFVRSKYFPYTGGKFDESHSYGEVSKLDFIPTVDPILGLVTRSCDPNISIVPVDGKGCNLSKVVMLLALQIIPAGSKVCALFPNYGCAQGSQILTEVLNGQNAARLEKGIKCRCDYCEQLRRDDPDGVDEDDDDDDTGHYQLGCVQCRGLVSRRTTSDPFRCTDCEQEVAVSKVKSIHVNLHEYDKQAAKLMASLNKCFKINVNPCELLLQLEELIDKKMAPLLYRGSLRLVYLYEQLRMAYQGYSTSMSNNFGRDFGKALDYFEKGLTPLEVRYGEDSFFVFEHMYNLVKWVGTRIQYDPVFSARWVDTKQLYGLVPRFLAFSKRTDKLQALFR